MKRFARFAQIAASMAMIIGTFAFAPKVQADPENWDQRLVISNDWDYTTKIYLYRIGDQMEGYAYITKDYKVERKFLGRVSVDEFAKVADRNYRADDLKNGTKNRLVKLTSALTLLGMYVGGVVYGGQLGTGPAYEFLQHHEGLMILTNLPLGIAAGLPICFNMMGGGEGTCFRKLADAAYAMQGKTIDGSNELYINSRKAINGVLTETFKYPLHTPRACEELFAGN